MLCLIPNPPHFPRNPAPYRSKRFCISYDLPIFGADLVSLPGVHLVCIDLQPARDGQTLGDGNDAALKEINRRASDDATPLQSSV